MVTSNKVLDLIKRIIARRYAHLALTVLGKDSLSPEEIKELKARGIEIKDTPSMIELAYFHSLINEPHIDKPTSVEDMKTQQKQTKKPTKEEIEYAKQHANSAMKLAIDKMRQDQTTRILNIIQENNQNFKFGNTKNVNQSEEIKKLIKESTVAQLKSRLRDASGDANRDWERIAVTEVAHAIAMGATDRVIEDNLDKNPDEIYVYKIPVVDAALCSFCREAWLDSDGSPKVYTLSHLLSNGSNYGKKRSDWAPTVSPSHPFDRESGIIELKRGWKVLPGGRQTYIGSKEWTSYILNKVIK